MREATSHQDELGSIPDTANRIFASGKNMTDIAVGRRNQDFFFRAGGSPDVEFKLPAYHLGETGSIPGGVTPPPPPPDCHMWESCWTTPLMGGFSRVSSVFPPLHSDIPCSRFTLIGSQELEVKSRPNLFIHCNAQNNRCRQAESLRPIPDQHLLLASRQGEPGSIPGGITPGFLHVGIVPEDAAGRRVFSGFSRFPCSPQSSAASYSPPFNLIDSQYLDPGASHIGGAPALLRHGRSAGALRREAEATIKIRLQSAVPVDVAAPGTRASSDVTPTRSRMRSTNVLSGRAVRCLPNDTNTARTRTHEQLKWMRAKQNAQDLDSPLVDDRPIVNAVKYRVVCGVVWTNRTMVSSNTDTNRTGVLAVVDIVDSLLICLSASKCAQTSPLPQSRPVHRDQMTELFLWCRRNNSLTGCTRIRERALFPIGYCVPRKGLRCLGSRLANSYWNYHSEEHVNCSSNGSDVITLLSLDHRYQLSVAALGYPIRLII
ncbi:hypothetical protein PR048_022255 [Dryococelus australis]|uniref:Uncharacterized protein n=1 Tax=Dryococelus australis TaxID=614101 RepID=A0ABQ9H0I0_9NEOP|nr:hypothetical protein PR048_022255 [Dryococelus australis]